MNNKKTGECQNNGFFTITILAMIASKQKNAERTFLRHHYFSIFRIRIQYATLAYAVFFFNNLNLNYLFY